MEGCMGNLEQSVHSLTKGH